MVVAPLIRFPVPLALIVTALLMKNAPNPLELLPAVLVSVPPLFNVMVVAYTVSAVVDTVFAKVPLMVHVEDVFPWSN